MHMSKLVNSVVTAALIASVALSQSRTAKMADMWAKITANPYTPATLPSWSGKDITSPGNLFRFARVNMAESFDIAQDTMPNGHYKVIHSLGAVAKAVFIPDPSSKYSGMFKGADSCLARLSLAKTPGDSDFLPGMAFKCFRDGPAPAGNFITMFSLDGQKENFNFFQNPFSNVCSTPSSTALKIVSKVIFARASKCPTWISTKDFAAFDQAGIIEPTNAWPIQMFLVPTQQVQFPATAGKDFRLDLLSIPAGTRLWDVYGQDFNKPSTRVRIGQIETRSAFVSSQYADEQIYFQHARGELDNCTSGDIATGYYVS